MSNQYTFKVPFSADVLASEYASGMTQAEIAEKYGVTQRVVFSAMKKCGIASRVAAKRNQDGALNSNWKGGRPLMAVVGSGRFCDRGYTYLKLPNHPNADKRGYVAEHIVVATKSAGRAMSDGECVHHVDLNKQHNAAENLEICTRKKHREYHLQLELIAVDLLRNGKVKFTPGVGYSVC